jgi:hypothetical protein
MADDEWRRAALNQAPRRSSAGQRKNDVVRHVQNHEALDVARLP